MSEPKRYEHMSDGMGRWFINPRTGKLAPYGEYVLHSDYAALLATNERVCQRFAKTQCEANEAEAENARLKAEVERLKNQRAKLIESAEELFRFVGEELYGPIDHFEAAWNAAKEGKPSV